MPLFIFVSGYLSKNIIHQRKKEINQVLYAYIIFEIIHLIFTKLTSIGWGSYNLFIPSGQDWYLLGLFFWRLLLPFFNLFKKKVSLIILLIISFAIGFYQEFNTFLGLYRIIYFMPFFVLGSYCNDIHLLKNRYIKFRPLLYILLIISFSFIAMLSLSNADLSKAIAYAFTPFKGYGSTTIDQLILRFFLRLTGFISQIAISFCFLFIVPDEKTAYTSFGRHTLNVYLSHIFFVFTINWLFMKLDTNILIMTITSIIMSLIFTIGLSSNLVDRIMLPLTNWNNMYSLLTKFRLREPRFGLTQ